jgi:hypothetical protein
VRVHRNAHARDFTVLPNRVLRDNTLSLAARGLLAYLISLPDGTQNDVRSLAHKLKEGRMAVSRALNELKDAGYYFVVRERGEDGRFVVENHIHDTPQLGPPLPTRPGPGERDPEEAGEPLRGKERDEEPPTRPSAEAALLLRVGRGEPRLRVGTAEAESLAPLVAQWLERGADERQLAAALLPGLPRHVHAPAALIADRLRRKMPPKPEVLIPGQRRAHECAECRAPVTAPGICGTCAGLAPPPPRRDEATRTRGLAAVRAALDAARRGACVVG